MKIVNRKEFLKMSEGTVFSKYEPQIFNDLMIKDDSPSGGWGNDFLYSSLVGSIDCNSSEDRSDKCEAMEKGESLPVDFEATGRDGMFDEDQLFAIYEPSDVDELIKRLITANSSIRISQIIN